MKQKLKKCLSLFLVLSLLMGVTYIPAAAEGSAGTIYVAVETPSEDVAQGSTFEVSLNFSNNPSDIEQSLHAYLLLLEYDSAKVVCMNVENIAAGASEKGSLDYNTNLNDEGVVSVGWAGTNGISTKGFDSSFKPIYTPIQQGELVRLTFGAKVALTVQEISDMFKLVDSCAGKNMSMTNGLKENFNTVSCPALSATLGSTTLYSNANAETAENSV